MTPTSWLLVVVAYGALAHAVWVPASAWVAADREKTAWVVVLAIPVLNVFGLIGYVLGVLPFLVGPTGDARTHPLRRGGHGGPATRSRWAPTPAPGAATPSPAPGRPAALTGVVSPLPGPPAVDGPIRTVVTAPVEPSTGPIVLPAVTATVSAAPAPAVGEPAVPVPPLQAGMPVFTAPTDAARDVAVPTTAAASFYSGPVSTVPGSGGSRFPAPPGGFGPLPPPVRRTGWSTPVAAILAAATTVVAGGLTWFLVRGDSIASADVSRSPTTSVVAGATSPDPSGVVPDDTTTASAPGPAAELDAQADEDRSGAESLVGRWVPQIGSKQDGTVDHGVTYDDAAIWADVVSAKERHPGTLLLRSADFSSFRRGGFWVLVVPNAYDTAAESNSWCDANGFAPADCYAKRLSHTEGPQGNTEPR